MPDFDPSAPTDYNSMQQQAGLIPPPFQPPPVIFPGQVSAAMAQGGVSATSFLTQGSVGTSFGAGAFPGRQLQGFTNQAPMFQGPTGVMMPMAASAPFAAYPGMNPYAGLGAYGPYNGPPGLFTPLAPSPPPAYSGQMAARNMFTPPPPSAQFNMAYAADLQRQQLAEDAAYTQHLGFGGVAARIGAAGLSGMVGARLGRGIGGGFGSVIGGFAGMIGSEYFGLGQGAQNLFMNQIGGPLLNQRAMAGGIEEMSQGFVNSGSFLHDRGRGFTHHASAEISSQLRDMANSSRFQMDTGNRFNQQDLYQITQSASRSDMMTGVQNPAQMTSRVRDIAKSLSAFMELAQEPDIQRAISTMGQLRSSGLNLSETTRAVVQGRQFARMAGTSFGELMDVGGALGSQTFQSMGLTQGLGLQTGMQNYALARGAQLGGTLSPQLMNLVGGAQGLGNLNNLFSAGTLQMSMLAPSVMSASGGVNMGALQNLIGGGTNAFSQTTSATAALQAMTGRQGVGGLGMAIAMQPLMQDTIGRALQAQGPFAQRNFEDRNVLNTMRQMGMTGAGGFITMAQTMGMDRNQAVARAQELSDPAYYERQRAQIETSRRENRRAELDRHEAERPGFFDTLTRLDPTGYVRQQRQQAFELQLGLRHLGHIPSEISGVYGGLDPQNAMDVRDLEATADRDLSGTARGIESEMVARRGTTGERRRTDYQLARARGYEGLGAYYDMAGMTTRGAGQGFLEDTAGAMFGGPAVVMGLRLAGRYARSESPEEIANRENLVNEYRGVGRFAGDILNTSRSTEISALRNVGRTFGEGAVGANRRAEFAGLATRALYGQGPDGMSEGAGAGLNLFTRAGAQLGMAYVGGPLAIFSPDIGNVVGLGMGRERQLEDAYVQSMSGSGQSEEALRRNFQENKPQISQQISSIARASMTPAELARTRDVAQFGQGLSGQGGTGFIQAAQARQTGALGRMFGREFVQSESHRQAIRGIFERTASAGEFGRNAEERTKSRDAMAALAMYQAVINNPRSSPESVAKAREKMNQLSAHIQLQFGPERGTDMINSVSQDRRIAGGINESPEEQAAAEAFVNNTSNRTPEQILESVTSSRREDRENETLIQMTRGANVLSRRGGALGEVFQGLGGENFSMSRLEDRIGSLSDTQMQDLERGNDKEKQVGRAARMMRSGDARQQEQGRILMQRALSGDASRATALKREYASQVELRGEMFGDVPRLFRAAARAVGVGQTEREFIDEGLMSGTAADEEADRQLGGLSTLQEAFRGAFGGNNNELVQASSELREAARALQGAVAGRGLDNLLP